MVWAVGNWNEEGVPSDLIASRLREAALLFDNIEAKNLGNQERKAFNHGWTRMNTDAEQSRAGGRRSKKPMFPLISGYFRLF